MKAKLFYSCFILWILFSMSNACAQKMEFKPVNEELTKYYSSDLPTSYIPLPFKIDHSQKGKRTTKSLPASYDLRNLNGISYVLPPRNQVNNGPCWAFAATDAVQSTFYLQGYREGYLSPQLLTNCHGFEYTKTQGGNSLIATACFARLLGPAYENSVPYVFSNSTCPTVTKADFPAYVSNVIMLPDDISTVKEAIMENGSVTARMFYSSSYYNSSNYTYYYDYSGTYGVNHGISIVGWDDSKTVTGNTSGTPKNTGAWIVKNTWGTNTMDGGYFYVSYEDKYVGTECFSFTKRVDKDAIDNLYLYDYLGMTSSIGYGVGNAAYGKVKYTAPKREKITAIGTFLSEDNTQVRYWIFSDASLTKMVGYSANTSFENAGFYSIDPVNPTYVEGDFYIVVRYLSTTKSYVLPIETVISGYSNPTIQNSGLQWVSSNGLTWSNVGTDISDKQFNLCIKAYTKNSTPPANDSIKNATLLNEDVLYESLTNEGATVETNEPCPPYSTADTSCYSQKTWCSEGGLQNSVWFKFVATTNSVSIETEGFDNQIALWTATGDDWENIVSGNTSNYQLIAANDDKDASNASGTISNVSGLVIGKTYFIQLDGSSGGKEGVFSIIINTITTDITEAKNNLNVFNENGEIKSEIFQTVEKIEVYEIGGKLMQTITSNNSKTIQKLPSKQVYILKLYNKNNTIQSISFVNP